MALGPWLQDQIPKVLQVCPTPNGWYSPRTALLRAWGNGQRVSSEFDRRQTSLTEGRYPAGAPSPLTDASPEGLRYLTDCIATFREKQVAFLHGASIDLRSRAEALRSEAGKHAAAVAELSELAANLEVRQEGLEGRISRLQQLHDNLVERAGA